MLKKLLLIVGTFAAITVAFALYFWQQDPLQTPGPRRASAAADWSPETRPSTQPVLRMGETKTNFADVTQLPPGSAGVIRVFDEETGELKYFLETKEFAPITDTDYRIAEPNAQILLPGGQLAHVRADTAKIVFQRSGRRFEPKRGEFRGNVSIVLDRTTPQWRKEHPELLDPESHPETLIKFWLDDVRFDLDLAQLLSDGPIRVESPDGSIEGTGLELLWNEVNRRILKLRIAEGKRATFKTTGLVSFGPPDSQGPQTRPAMASAGNDPPAPPPGETRQPEPGAFTFADPGDLRAPPKADRIDAYQIVFRDNVHAEQRNGSELVGRIKADLLEAIVELGQKEREAVQRAPTTRPAARPAPKAPAARPEPEPLRGVADAASTIVLQWTGEVLVLPETPTLPAGATAEEQRTGSPERFHIVATGDPVEVTSPQRGDARCQRLEYHHESQKLWLTGTAGRPVRMKSGPRDQLFGQKIFFDQKTGHAQVDGPGRLISSRRLSGEPELPQEISHVLKSGSRRASAAESAEQTILAWHTSAQIEFGLYEAQMKDPATGQTTAVMKEYLKHAVFEGGVTLDQPGQSMAAEHVDVRFRKPGADAVSGTEDIIADRILAAGRVRLFGDRNEISCDAIEVEMTVDDTGRNVPDTGRASGHVTARQESMVIEARDELFVTLVSRPVPVSERERLMLENAARQSGYTESSPEWKATEQKLRDRRETGISTLNARGDVTIRDPQQGLDVTADNLDCSFSASGQITRSTINGQDGAPAHVQTSDFYIRGPRILMDMATQSLQVPGSGLLRFANSQELDGQPTAEPVPVVVTWGGQMRLDGQLNIGTFTHHVKVRSGSSRASHSTLDCRDLTLRFQNVPKAPAANDSWLLGSLAQFRRPGNQDGPAASEVRSQLRKRLVHVHAIGEASMETKAYEVVSPVKGYLAQAYAAHLPAWMQQAPARAQPSRRLASGAFIKGPQIVIDLVEENLVVQGAGNLLVRDYRIASRGGRGRRADANAGTLLSDAAPGSLTGFSPGHTVFTWKNSMSFLNRRNIAVFDHRVEMVHQSGSQLKWTAELAAATGLNSGDLQKLKGRRVGLSTDHLLVEFRKDPSKGSLGPGSLAKATQLKSFNASGRVHLQEEAKGTGRSLEGAEVTYSDETGIVRVHGTSRNPAQGMVVNLDTGGLQALQRGSKVELNVKTGLVRIVEASTVAPGR